MSVNVKYTDVRIFFEVLKPRVFRAQFLKLSFPVAKKTVVLLSYLLEDKHVSELVIYEKYIYLPVISYIYFNLSIVSYSMSQIKKDSCIL